MQPLTVVWSPLATRLPACLATRPAHSLSLAAGRSFTDDAHPHRSPTSAHTTGLIPPPNFASPRHSSNAVLFQDPAQLQFLLVVI